MPRLSGGRSGRPTDSLPSAPLGAQSDPFPTDPPGAAPASRRGEAAAGGRARPGLRRPVFAGALAYALLGFAALLAAPQAAHAVDKEIWSATLTTAASSTVSTVFGYAYWAAQSSDRYGSLSADSVSDLGSARSVEALYNDNASGGTLKFGVTHLSSDPLDTAAFRERLVLYIESESFAGENATFNSFAPPLNTTFTWSNSSLTWAAAQSISARLTLSVPGIDSIAFNSAGSDNTFYLDDAVKATVTFDEAVTVTGTPQLTIDVGGADKVLSYSSGSGSTALVFTGYTVASGETDTNGLSIAANQLTLNSGTIKASAGGSPDAVLTYTAVAASASHTVSGVAAPMVPSAVDLYRVAAHATTTPGSVYVEWSGGNGSTSHEFRSSTDSGMTWSHDVTDDWPDVTTDSRGLSHLAGLTPGTAYTFEVRGRNADGPGPAGQNTGTTAAAMSIAGVELTSNPAMGTTYDTGEDVEATLTFSRPVTFAEVGGNLPQLELDFGGMGKPATCAATNQQTAVVCTYTVVSGDTASAGVAIAANKLTLNGGTIRMGAGSLANIDYAVPLAHTALAADTDHKVSATTVLANPTVDSFAFNSAGSDNTFAIDDAVTATVTFSEAVNVVTTGGMPQLTIDMGSSDKVLNYASGTGTAALVFSGYTVAANDEDTDGLSIAANKLDANGGTIKATAGANPDAVLTHAAVPASASHKVDGIRPTLVTTGDNAPKTSTDGTKIILTFSENIELKITSSFSSHFPVTIDGTAATVDSATRATLNSIELTLASTDTVSAGEAVTVALASAVVSDVVGNLMLVGVTARTVTNNVPPAVISGIAVTSNAGADKTYGIDDEIEVTVTFDKAVDITGAPIFEIIIGQQTNKGANCVSGTNTTTMVCAYEVALNDATAHTVGQFVVNNGVVWSPNSVKLNGGTIRNTGTTVDATLSHSRRNENLNHLVDGIRPTLVTTGDNAPKTSTDGTEIILTFSEIIGTVVDSSLSFTVRIAGSVARIDGITGANTTVVTLTLDSADTVSAGETVTVALAEGAVADDAGNGNAALAATSVTNNSLVSPTVTGVALTSGPGSDNTYAIGDVVVATVTFSEAVDITGTPRLELDFDGTETPADCAAHGTDTTKLVCSHAVVETNSAPNGIAIAANKLTLNSGTIKEAGSTTVNAVLDHDAVMIDSGHKVDGVKPTLSSADASSDLTKVVLTFSEAIGTADNTKITVKKGGTDQTTTGAAIDSANSTKVEITLMTALLSTDTNITVELAADAVTDVPGNGIDAVSSMAVSLVDNTAPTFASAGTSGTDKVVLTYSEALDTGSQPATSAFTVEVGGVGRGVDTVAISGSAVTLTLASAFRPGDALTVSYAKPGSNPIKDAANNEAVSLAETTVTNNLTATVPDAPGNLAATAGTDAGTMALTWDTPWHNGSDITEFEVRYAAGMSVPASTNWEDITNSNATTTSYTVTGLTAGTEYTFEVRAVNGIGNGAEASVTKTVLAPVWEFTLTDSNGDPVTELTEGGDPATATVKITNSVRFGTNQTVNLEWGGFHIRNAAIQGAGGTSTITITAGQSSGTLEISAPEPGGVARYIPPDTKALTATHGGTQIGSIDLTYVDDESVPVASITEAPTTVNEGENIEIEITLTPTSGIPGNINFAVTDADSALTGTLPTNTRFAGGQATKTVTLTTDDNTTQNDGARDVTLTLALNDDFPYTLGTTSSVTVEVLDNDTPPTAPRNLTAQAGLTEVDLTWQAPATDHGQPLTYEYRQQEGTDPFGDWTAILNSDIDTTEYTVTGLTMGTDYTFEVRAENVAGGGDEASVPVTTLAPEWEFTLTDSGGDPVTELTEGGASATATVKITNSVTFGTEQTVTLKWGIADLSFGLIVGAGGVTAITIPAGQSSGSLEISSPQIALDSYVPPFTHPLTATHGGTEIGSIDLAFVDDEPVTAATITDAPTTVNEGESIEIEITLSPPFANIVGGKVIKIAVTDADGALTGTLPTDVFFSAGRQTETLTLTSDDNSTQNDGARDVTFALALNPDAPYTLGTTSSVTVTVRDNDTPPTAPRNLTAQAGDTTARLQWQAPLAPVPDHGQPILHYEYRLQVGSAAFSDWAPIPGGDENTTSHTFTGLTNETLHTYEVRAANIAGGGAAASTTVTPIVGVGVSFGAASLSVDEGEGVAVTVTLAAAPTASVTVPLVATRGVGLDAGEYSGVPASVVFNAGETSKSFTVTTVEDTADEPNAVLTVTFGPLPAGYIVGTHAELALTVVDDDHPIVSATFDRATATASEGDSVAVTVRLSQAPEREVVLPLVATRGANLDADEVEGVPASVTIAADATQARFTVTFTDDVVEEGNETLTLTFGTTLPDRVNSAGANPQLVLTVTDDDGPPLAPDVSVRTGDGYAALSWAPVANDSPVTRYEVRWRESDGGTFGAWKSVGLDTSYRVEGLANGKAYEFEVRAVNAHGDGEWASAPGTPTARLTGIPKAVQVLNVKATDSGRAELSWTRPANGTDRVTANSATATFAQLQGYRIEVCRTPCDDWYAVVPNTRKFEHKYVHQVLAPGVIRENRYRVQAININGKTGPWSNVATLDPTVVENFRLQTPDDSTLWVRFRVRNPDGNKLYVRYTNTGTDAVAYTERRLRKKGDVKLDLTGLQADSWYRVDLDFVDSFDSSRKQSRWYGTARAGHTPLKSPYAVDALDAQVFAGGQWRDASDTALYVRMGGTGRYRVRLKPCQGIHDVIVHRIQAPAGRLRASPMDTDPVLFTNLNCESEFDDWRRDEHGNRLTMDQVYDMTNFPDRAKDHIPIYAGTPNNWQEVTVTARALEDYPADRRHDALLSAPFAVVYNHEVWKEVTTSSSYLVSEGTGLVRVSLDRPADATLPEPSGVTIARAAGASGGPVMRWDAVPGATGYKVEWRHGVQYSTRANQNRSLVTATSVTLPLGGSWRGPITARVRAYSSSGVSGWVERTWDSRPPTLNVLDTAVNEADGSVGFLVTLSPAASGQVTVAYTTVDDTAVAGTDYTATSGTVTFAPGQTRRSTAQVPITDDGEEDSGETFRLVLSNPAGSDANNGAAVLGDADAVATILNSEQDPAELTGFTLVDAGTNGDLMVLAAGSTVALGEWLAPSYGIRAETGPGAAPGSVRLALSGAKTVTYTDDAAPWSLYGDGAGRVNGEALPPGAYTLRATAYADSGGRGEERGSLEVAFTVTAGALGVTTPGPFPVAEGTTAVTTLGATQTGTGDAVSWSIPEGTAGGADGAAFALTAKGVLSLVAAKDFEAPDDADGDGTYEVTVAVREGAQTATAALSVTLTDVEEVPLAVTTPGPFTVAEGTTAVAELEGSETGTGVAASWSIPAGTAGGADGAAFTLTPEGVLSLTEAKDFETPDDADGDGTYDVTVAVAVPAAVAAGAQRATAALLVTLTDVNEAPVATATAARERVREGAEVTLDGSASTDPDASDTLSHAWTQIQDGAPRVTLSDATAAQPVFTSPSDLAAETELAFTLRVTDAEGLYAEAAVTVTVTLISEVSVAAASGYAAEGADAVFRLTRAGSALKALTVPVTVEETGAMLGADVPESATFAAGAREAELRVPTAVDAVSENDSLVTVRLGSGPGWQLAPDGAAASLTVLDDDVAPSVSAADVTIWSADMTVVEYGPRSIGAGSAAQFSNQMGRAGLRAKWLWYDPVARKLKLGFDDSLDDAEALTLHVGAVSLGFPANSGGDSSFSLEHVDIAWTDGETLAVRVSKPSAAAVSTDATLATLTVAGATLSPAFDAGVLVYRAVADAETVTLAATATDGGAAVTYGPAADADAELAHHQVAAPEGETLVAVTVTAADGTVRRYRVVVAQGPATAQAVANTAPTGRPVITGTETVGEELSASTETITDADGLDTATFTYQWLANDGTEDTALAGATEDTWTLTPAEAGKTITVRVTFTDDKGTEETLVSEATEPVAAVAPSAPVGLAAATAEDRERELTVSWSAPESDGGSEVTGYRVQWKSGTEAYDGSQTSARQAVLSEPAVLTHTIAGIANGTAYTVRVLAVNAVGAGAAAEAGATVEDRVVPVLTKATVDGATLTLTYSEALDQDSAPSAGTFAVTVTGAARGVDGVALSESAVVLTLASGVVSGETVTVGYAVPADAGAARIEDAAGNAAAGFTGAAATNETEASNAAPAGLPEVSGTAEVGEALTVSVDDIADADGLETATFTYRWLADDGTVETAIAGASGESWTLTPAEAGRTVRVRVTYTDDKGTQETLVSEATDAVVDRRPVAATLSVGDGAAEAGRFRLRIAFADAVTGLGVADVSAARVGGDAAAVSELAEAETGRVWTAWVAAAEAGRYTVRLAAGAAQSGARQSLASVLAVDVDAAGNAASVAGPVVTAVALAPAGDGSRTDGDEVRVTLAFSVAVTVDTAAGTPSVGIGLDGDARQAAYASGTGTASLVFVYAVTGDDGTVSAVTVTADSLAVNGGTIRDADGRDANLAHPGDGDASAPEPEEAAVQEAESETGRDERSGGGPGRADGELHGRAGGAWRAGLGSVRAQARVQRGAGAELQRAAQRVAGRDGRAARLRAAPESALEHGLEDQGQALGLGRRDGDARGRAGLRHVGCGLHGGRQGSFEHGGGGGAGPARAQRCGRAGPGGRERGAGVRGDPQPGGDGDGDGGLRDGRRHRDGGGGLHRGLGHADLPGRRDGEDGGRRGPQRRARRRRGDTHAHLVGPDGGADPGCRGDGDDRELRPDPEGVAGALRAHGGGPRGGRHIGPPGGLSRRRLARDAGRAAGRAGRGPERPVIGRRPGRWRRCAGARRGGGPPGRLRGADVGRRSRRGPGQLGRRRRGGRGEASGLADPRRTRSAARELVPAESRRRGRRGRRGHGHGVDGVGPGGGVALRRRGGRPHGRRRRDHVHPRGGHGARGLARRRGASAQPRRRRLPRPSGFGSFRLGHAQEHALECASLSALPGERAAHPLGGARLRHGRPHPRDGERRALDDGYRAADGGGGGARGAGVGGGHGRVRARVAG